MYKEEKQEASFETEILKDIQSLLNSHLGKQRQKTKRNVAPSIKKAIWLEQKQKCFFCHKSKSLDDLTIEHLDPVSNGGSNDMENLVLCCDTSNNKLGNLSFKKKLELILTSNHHRDLCKDEKIERQKQERSTKREKTKELTEFKKYIVEKLHRQDRPKKFKTLVQFIYGYASRLEKNEIDEEIEGILHFLEETKIIQFLGEQLVYLKEPKIPCQN